MNMEKLKKINQFLFFNQYPFKISDENTEECRRTRRKKEETEKKKCTSFQDTRCGVRTI
jgi:hypothetical protein